MNSTRNFGFLAKCLFCAEEYYNCRESFKNVVCAKCHKKISLIEFQNDTQIESQIKKLEDKCMKQEEKIAKLQQNEKISQQKYNDLEDMYYKK
jgi:hypothetical protein